MTEYNKLINDINNGKLSPVYLIHGEESFFTNNIIKTISNAVINEDSADFDLKKISSVRNDYNVVHYNEVPQPGLCFIVVLAGGNKVRGEVNDFLVKKGYEVEKHYLHLA